MENKTFNLRKRIASAGNNTIIVIPKLLQDELKKGTVVDVRINIIEEVNSENESAQNLIKSLGDEK